MKYSSFEEMKAAVSGEAVNEEVVEKRHTSWMDAIRKLKKDMKEMENNPLGKTQAEIECLENEIYTLKLLQLEEEK